jgi:hypothetical protein
MSLNKASGKWREYCSNPLVTDWICNGAKIPFRQRPPPFLIPNYKLTTDQEHYITQEISKLLLAGTIRKTTSTYNTSPLGVVPKKNGKLRMILDLRRLNSYIATPRFAMEDIRKVRPLLQTGDFMTSIDLKDGFHHVPIHPDHQQHLGMSWQGQSYCWTHLPFGLSASPYIFCKTLRETINILRRQGIRCNCYMDDLLILGHTKKECEQATATVLKTLETFGWQVNREKSSLTPTQQLDYLGFTLTTSSIPTISLQREKLTALKKDFRRLISAGYQQQGITARRLARTLGTLIANSPAVEPTPIMTRHLFSCLRQKTTWESLIYLDADAMEELKWWHANIREWKSTPTTLTTPTMVMTTDASTTGWGATLEGYSTAHGFFPPEIQARSSNYRELYAVLLALGAFKEKIQGQHLLLRTDNITTMFYVNGQGGPHKHLNRLAKLIFWAVKECHASLRSLHLPGDLNTRADELSRLNPMTEWSLHPETFQQLEDSWGPHTVDRFATSNNSKLPRYNSRFHDPRAEATDSMTQDWSKENNYVCPPWRMLPQVLNKIRDERCQATVIAPLWPSAPWFHLLLRLSCDLFCIDRQNIIPALTSGSAEPLRNSRWRLAAFRISGRNMLLTGTSTPAPCSSTPCALRL